MLAYAAFSLGGANLYREKVMPYLITARDALSEQIANIPLDPESHLLAESERARHEAEEEREQLRVDNIRLNRLAEQRLAQEQLSNENFYAGIKHRNLPLYFAFHDIYSEVSYTKLEEGGLLYNTVIEGYPELTWMANHMVIEIRTGEGRDNFDIILIPSTNELSIVGTSNAQFGVLTAPPSGSMELCITRLPYNDFLRYYPEAFLPPEQR